MTVSPAQPNHNDDLTCNIDVESTDPDGDAVTYSYTWTRDGSPTGNTGATLSGSQTGPGESWSCTATPNDGVQDGPSGSSSPVTILCYVLDFDGVDDWVDVPVTDLGGSFTIEAWMNFDGLASSPQATPLFTQVNGVANENCGTYDCLLLTMQDQGIWTIHWHNESTTTETNWVSTGFDPTGTWTHIAATFDSGTLSRELWVDGQLRAQTNAPSVFVSAPSVNAYIGRYRDGSVDPPPDGQMAAFRISDAVRYSTDFTPPTAFTPDGSTLVLYEFTDGSGTTLSDSSGNDRDGTISGPVWTTAACL